MIKEYSLDIYSFADYIKQIRYGYKDTKGILHYLGDEDFNDYEYSFSTPEEVVANNCGWCWDVVELIKEYCDYNSIESLRVFMEYKDDSFHQTHTQVFVKIADLWYPFPDNSSSDNLNSLIGKDKDDAISDFASKFKDFCLYTLKDDFKRDCFNYNVIVSEFSKGMTDTEYIKKAKEIK